MKKPSEYLKEAMDLHLANPCERVYATDHLGRETSVYDPKATNFCSSGALIKVTRGLPNTAHTLIFKYITVAADEILKERNAFKNHSLSVIIVNDYHPHLVELMFQKAIELAQKDGQ